MSKQKGHTQVGNKKTQRAPKQIFLAFFMFSVWGCILLAISGMKAIDIFSMRPSEESVFFEFWEISTALASLATAGIAIFTLIFIAGAVSSLLYSE